EAFQPRFGLELGQADRTRELAPERDVDQLPARLFGRALRVVVVALAIELGRVGIGFAGDFGNADHAGLRATGVVEQHAVALAHLVAHVVARLVVAHAAPRFPAHAP